MKLNYQHVKLIINRLNLKIKTYCRVDKLKYMCNYMIIWFMPRIYQVGFRDFANFSDIYLILFIFFVSWILYILFHRHNVLVGIPIVIILYFLSFFFLFFILINWSLNTFSDRAQIIIFTYLSSLNIFW